MPSIYSKKAPPPVEQYDTSSLLINLFIAAAINKFINKDEVSYCSTGGGAFLEYMEGKLLPSIEALGG